MLGSNYHQNTFKVHVNMLPQKLFETALLTLAFVTKHVHAMLLYEFVVNRP